MHSTIRLVGGTRLRSALERMHFALLSRRNAYFCLPRGKTRYSGNATRTGNFAGKRNWKNFSAQRHFCFGTGRHLEYRALEITLRVGFHRHHSARFRHRPLRHFRRSARAARTTATPFRLRKSTVKLAGKWVVLQQPTLLNPSGNGYAVARNWLPKTKCHAAGNTSASGIPLRLHTDTGAEPSFGL